MKKRRKITSKRVKRIILYFFLTIVMAFFLGPFYWIFITSIQSRYSLYTATPNFIPREITFSNYANVLFAGRLTISRALINSLIVATSVTFICIIFSVFSSYAFARFKFKGSNIIFVALICTEMLPPVALLIPFYLLFKSMGLVNTLQGLIIFYTSWLLPITTWILFSYFKTIPKDLEDSARIDGASRVGALFKIVIPVSLPGIVSASIICFIFSMGEFMGAVALINKDAIQTLPMALAQYVTKFSVEYGNITAGSILAVIFPIVFVLIFQKLIIKGITAGAVKE